jgi:hypothetical protein
MLTLVGGNAPPTDVQVNGADDIREAIVIAEKATGRRVDHGRGGIGSKFDPALIIDAITGETDVRHDRGAATSMTFVKGRARI